MVIRKYNLNEKWTEIQDHLNDYVHSNTISNITANTNTIFNEDISIYFDDINEKIEYLLAIFIVLLILTIPHAIMSSDYIDALECGLKPIEDSQYWVAPFITDFIENHIVKFGDSIKDFLNDSSCMDIIN